MATISEVLAIAVQHHQSGHLEEAERIYRQVLVANPNHPDAWHLLGVIARWAGNPALAVEYLERATELSPRFAAAHYNLGNVFRDTHRLDEAAASYRRAIELEPDFAEAHCCLGYVLLGLGNWEEAATCLQRAIKLSPNDVEARNSLGVIFQDHGFSTEAMECFRGALAIRPNFAEAQFNLGRAFHEAGKYQDGWGLYRSAVGIIPDLADAHAGQGLLMLLHGDYDNGWGEYEWRWKTESLLPRTFRQPRWDGSPLESRTILLHAEQGFGDTIQFIRYAALVKKQNARATVFVECQRPLTPLLAKCPGIDRLISEGDELPAFDVHSPLLSLPGIFQTRLEAIPADVPYLFAEEKLVAEWRQQLAGIRGFRIGINWQGRSGQGEFLRRNVPLEYWAARAQLPGVSLISLQKGEGRDELLSACARLPILDLGPNFDIVHEAFTDTAAVMMNLDLVITSDTSIPHLAGALGVPVWLALPFVPDWRWLLDRADSPWYPTMRLFCQKSLGDWPGVFDEIRSALSMLIV